MTEKPKPAKDPRVIALRRFAISITIFNIFGYTLLGFEQPLLWPFMAIGTAYSLELLLEVVGARAEGRRPRFLGHGFRGLIEFLLPAHITALAVNMLLYANEKPLPVIFAVAVGISGKWIFRAPVRGRIRHFMNPSNLGITTTLLGFAWLSVAPPYHFTEDVDTFWDIAIVLIILLSGTMLNAMLTKKMWLIGAWLLAFAFQAIVRGLLFDTAILSALGIMGGLAFVLFTNYMISDPGTTPTSRASQIAFGAGAALAYGAFTAAGIAYGLFFGLTSVCLIRGATLWIIHFADKKRAQDEAALAASVAEIGAGAVAIATDPPAQLEEVKA